MKFRLLLLLVLLGSIFIVSNLSAQSKGQELFEEKKCFRCHDTEYNKLGPPLKVIAKTYAQNEKLLRYFNGEIAPIVKPKMADVMYGELQKIIKLNKEEKAFLANYIMNYK